MCSTNKTIENDFSLYVHIFISTFPVFLDYNAPLTENGAYTEKYNRAAEMISVYDTLSSLLGTSINDVGKVHVF